MGLEKKIHKTKYQNFISNSKSSKLVFNLAMTPQNSIGSMPLCVSKCLTTLHIL